MRAIGEGREKGPGWKHRWIKHEPRAELTDAGLQACSWGAKGVWRAMVNHMALSPEYGVLVVNGRAMTLTEIAKLLGTLERSIAPFVRELMKHGVPSKREDGAYFCRRMVREQDLYARNAGNGAMGGNPMLVQPQADPVAVPAASAAAVASNDAQTAGSSPGQARAEAGPSSGQARPTVVSTSNPQTLANDDNGLTKKRLNPPLNPVVKADSESEVQESGDGIATGGRAGASAGSNIVDLWEGQAQSGPAPVATQPHLPMPPVLATVTTEAEPPAPAAKPKRIRNRRPRGEPTGPLMRQGIERVPPIGSVELLTMSTDALAAWNRLALPTGMALATMTDITRRRICFVLRKHGGIKAWHQALEAAAVAPLWNGTGTSTWKPTIGAFCKAESFQKLLDGDYDRRVASVAGPVGPTAKPGKLSGAEQRMAERRAMGGR